MKAEIIHFDACQLGLVFVNSTVRANRFGALEGAGRQEMESGWAFHSVAFFFFFFLQK